jgi:hypothetical protein
MTCKAKGAGITWHNYRLVIVRMTRLRFGRKSQTVGYAI